MEYTTNQILSLISHIHTQTQEFTNSRLSEQGDYVSSHGFILYLLSVEGELTFGELTQRINRDKSTTTSLVKKLEEKGLVQIKKNPADSRIKMVSLTKEGEKLNSLTTKISEELISSSLKDFTEEEKNTLLSLLIKLSGNIQ